ncbi:B-cell receptor CD22-like [Myripristis murdjan]|uniref:B-cell receptor CD22-like n=1 Tax=Myripristis murdjan TaxID=586833 RepID=UPI0011763468|nr:B-cell receptor CD22-like [Myripristis murdjan]
MPSVSVSPSGEIVEGSSVTLTCSSDANPAANYTWYKENQTLLQGPEGSYNFTSISSEDTGTYHCQSENQYGQINSSSVLIDVQYGPRIPSVSVRPSGEIVEGSALNLTCSSDANPAANYTWYKKNETSPKALGQTFTITNITSEHSGEYYCEAQNIRGRHNSKLQLTVVEAAWKLISAVASATVLPAIILTCLLLWIRRKSATKQLSAPGEGPDSMLQLNSMYENISAAASRHQTEQQDELHYTFIHFTKKHEDPLYSNIMMPRPQKQEEEKVQYAAVNFKTDKTEPGTTTQGAEDDPSELYSKVQKFHKKPRA